MNIKYNEFGEVISVNGLTTGQHIGTPLQDAVGTPEENSCYYEECCTVTRCSNTIDDKQPEKSTGGGAPADWNAKEGEAGYVKNRTHYEEVTTTEVGGDTLTWDGNTEGKTVAVLNSGTYYHVSDAVPSAEAIQGGYTLVTFDGDSFPSTFVQGVNGIFVLDSMMALVCTADMVELGGGYVIPKKGVYFMDIIASLTIPNYTGFTTTETVTTVKTIDEKYMPILTSPSGNKFRITVSDDGTLSAVAV